jgi:hypothetical protein
MIYTHVLNRGGKGFEVPWILFEGGSLRGLMRKPYKTLGIAIS